GGIPGVKPANVAVLGGGVVGSNAAQIAAGMGALVTILDIDLQRLRYLHEVMPKNVMTVISNPQSIREAISGADLIIGAVLIAGGRTPNLISREMLQMIKPGAVIVDVSVDQGGCVETIRATTHREPTFIVDGIIHYGVENMPSAVPMTSTIGLTNATLPYIMQIADKGFARAIKENKEIALGANIIEGKVTHRRVAEAFSLPYMAPEQVVR
ncbi:alanine dehydrogenase, partial [candidate division KSB1 bacterium]|nr:alanine dehydrogenase [candidate division KSB1 bacterium]